MLPPAHKQIHFEQFRMFSESFGMQLDDDSLLALYHVHDPEGRWVKKVQQENVMHRCRVLRGWQRHQLQLHQSCRYILNHSSP